MDPYEMVKKAQTEFLERDLLTLGSRFANLAWWLMSTDASLVLGDVGPIAFSVEGDSAKPAVFYSPAEDLLVLPISSSLALVGGAAALSGREVMVSKMNRLSAELSVEFFVANQNQQEELDFQADLGKRGDYWRRQFEKSVPRDWRVRS